MKMKVVSLALLCAVVLAACAAPAEEKETLTAPAASASEQSADGGKDEEEFPNPGGQGMAIDAYDCILRSFGSPDPSGYPEEFADAYIGEDNFLYVCLTDTSETVLAHYRGVVTEPRILRFVQVEHSYRDLMALQTALAEIEGLDFSYIGVDVTGNEVDMGIPDLGKEEDVWALVEQQLPEEVKERFDQLPLTIEEEPYATFA